MRLLKYKKGHNCTGYWKKVKRQAQNEEGSGLLEAAVALIFLLLLMISSFEFLFVFTSYISLLNASSQAATYAAKYPDMEIGDPRWDKYESVVQAEALAGGLSWKDVTLNLPVYPPSPQPGDPLSATLNYQLTTPFGELFFPFLGKFGLPAQYAISATTTVPVR